MIYTVEASPEQLAMILKQLGQKAAYFSVPKIETPNSTGPGFAYGGMNSNGGFGRRNGRRGAVMGGPGQSRLARPYAAKIAPPPAQSQAAPAPVPAFAQQAELPAAATLQHVVFVLNVVDQLPAAAGRALQALPPVPAAPSKQ